MKIAAQLAGALLIAALVSGGSSRSAAEAAFERLDPNTYQSFVRNWKPENAPLCAVIRSQADWDKVLAPAARMGGTPTYAPPAAFWDTKAVLFVARVINAGNTADVFRVERVEFGKHTLELDYSYRPTPPASSTMKWYLAVAVAKPLPATVRFTEGGKVVCTLRTNRP
jgi:hypothetical protein